MHRGAALSVITARRRVRNVDSKESGMLHSVPPFEGERMIRPFAGTLALAAGLAITIPLLASPASAGNSPAPVLIPDSAPQPISTTLGGAQPQPSPSTLTPFFRTPFNPPAATTFG